ncbi:thioredoxin family protein, partial [Rhodoferax sp.]|uniref:thioredoxin family protein n=1 Tax=Rhodoferax sp. TaxID=50421 RepID=UPI00374D82A9
MLDDSLKAQLKSYLERVTKPFEIVASLDDSKGAGEMRGLLEDIIALSDKITLKTDGTDARKPSFSLNRIGSDMSLRFAAVPMGHEFTSLVLALLWTGGHPPKVEADVIDSIKTLDGDFNFEVYMSLSCHNCPDVVQALTLMSVFNPRIKATAIDGAFFKDEVEARKVLAVPSVYLNGEVFGQGRMELEQILAKLDTGGVAKAAEKIA